MPKTNDEKTNEVTPPVVTDPWKIKKSVMIPRLPNNREQPDFICSVNGRTCRIQRGVTVKVALPFYEVIQRSFKAEMDAEEYYYAKSVVEPVT